jgi:hypothetical protein
LLFDLQKYHPEGLECLVESQTQIHSGIGDTQLKQGIEEGHYRPE